MKFLILMLVLGGCAGPSIDPWYLPSGKIKNPFFYSLKKGKKHWYLLGTHHWLGIEELPEVVVKTFDKVPVTVFESIDDRSEQHSFLRTASKGKPSGFAQKILLKSGLSIETINKYDNDFLCYLFLRPRDLPPSMDSSLEEKARKKGNKLIGLEKAEDAEAISAKYRSPCDLEEVVRATGTLGTELSDQAVQDYRKGIYNVIEEHEFTSGYASVAERNKKWQRNITAINDKKAFIVVGAGHLGGQTGLLSLFESQGWAIERIVQ